MSTVALSHNPVLHSWTKHMELDLFFVKEKLLNKTLIVTHIPDQDQTTDLLTKPLSQIRFEELCTKLRVFDQFSVFNPP